MRGALFLASDQIYQVCCVFIRYDDLFAKIDCRDAKDNPSALNEVDGELAVFVRECFDRFVRDTDVAGDLATLVVLCRYDRCDDLLSHRWCVVEFLDGALYCADSHGYSERDR